MHAVGIAGNGMAHVQITSIHTHTHVQKVTWSLSLDIPVSVKLCGTRK